MFAVSAMVALAFQMTPGVTFFVEVELSLSTTYPRIAFIESTFKLHLATHHTFTLLSPQACLDTRRYASI